MNIGGSQVSTVPLSIELITGNVVYESMITEFQVEVMAKDKDPLRRTIVRLETILLGIVPLTLMYDLRFEAEIRNSFLDVGFSALGLLWSPLAFTFHLSKISKLESANIVVTSLTNNLTRLSLTMVIVLCIYWVFAITGWLVFQDFHYRESTAIGGRNTGGTCTNLLTCIFSYSWHGLVHGILFENVENRFPTSGEDLKSEFTGKLMWEIAFAMVSVRSASEVQNA